jgi:hypothetical protein
MALNTLKHQLKTDALANTHQFSFLEAKYVKKASMLEAEGRRNPHE